jgi:calcium-binding protein CML
MIADIDKDGSGAIDFDEFFHMMTEKMDERSTLEEIYRAFDILADSKSVSSGWKMNMNSS